MNILKIQKKSSISFNTPSVLGCHGWKLAEYLAMGKAIISTAITNEMPAPFINNIHYIECSSESEIEQSIKDLYNDIDTKLKLKDEAKQYFNQYLTPQKVIAQIFSKL